MYRHDYIKRQMELFAQALAGIAQKRIAGQYEDALADVRGTLKQLGIEDGFLDLDTRSLVGLLGSGRVTCLAELLEEEARIRGEMGDLDGSAAAQRRRKALAR